MLNDSQKEHFHPLRSEVYYALLAAWTFKAKLEALSYRLQTMGRDFLLEELVSLRTLANEVVLRLCNIDDKKSDFSFHAARKSMDKTGQLKRTEVDELNKAITRYRSGLNELKVKHRNLYIAHLTGDFYPDPMLVTEMVKGYTPSLREALDTLALIWGKHLSFGFHLGSRDRTIDFLEELGLKSG